jgi:hypothetical protein
MFLLLCPFFLFSAEGRARPRKRPSSSIGRKGKDTPTISILPREKSVLKAFLFLSQSSAPENVDFGQWIALTD